MNKDKLVDSIAEKLGSTKAEAERVINVALDEITNALSRGEEVALTGFGTFQVSSRQARAGVNPRTGEKIQIAAIKVPKFRAGKNLKEAVR
ncbi:MAG: Histone family protein DNA-binding protein [Parcubacteria group bacterium GW2011_GWC1_43_61]|nr:MAG: Histone family protein DNA-binding protein [Candidatus Azambacteria bacterium GW2011_GWF1_41_10]KKS49464.1 MAG: Histone family protein DNA-binding protein [Candidatus Azambacteria bacterium GW2011_GWF2_42_22]KKS69343.1 MAG: Histone family protein DNA-binding protein [Candidatus Azambacteria bacterium GW2011_GWA2_42_62]KKS74468.1 MAG: Histone family protein DNA-binding protein [Candidatus Azambacteria bacterium GW2011_GWB1_42_72]KKT03575.1 MAG: Histone family protein DNA-binding protein 